MRMTYLSPKPENSNKPKLLTLGREASHKSGIAKHAGCRTYRHSFATHLFKAGYDIRAVQKF